MSKLIPDNIEVRFIKLGANGDWEDKCINKEHTIKLGYCKGETALHNTCLKGDWDSCRTFWEKEKPKATSATITNDIRQIKDFYELDENTLWITFYGKKLYWAFCSKDIVEENDFTRTRKVISNNGEWSYKDAKGRELSVDNLDGRLTKVARYQGTICDVHFKHYLIRRINGEILEESEKAKEALKELKINVEKLIKGLWWKDFELLTDLVFSRLGWQRYSVVGKTEKWLDLDLYSPSIQKHVAVQIKSNSNREELEQYSSKFESEHKGYYALYYVCHSGLDNLSEDEYEEYQKRNVKIVNCKQMAELVVSAGLVEWLINKRS